MPDHLAPFQKNLERLRTRADRDELLEAVEGLLAQWAREREDTARRLNRMTENLQTLDSRLRNVENSRVFRLLQRSTGYLRAWRTKGKRYVAPSHNGASLRREYHLWLERQRLLEPPAPWCAERIASFGYLPRFSVFLHLTRPRREPLLAAVDSLLKQSYPYWDLCVCDDANPDGWLPSHFQSLASADPRIQYVRSEHVMGAVSSLNRAGMLGAGEYLMCLGQHDLLAPHALFRTAEALQDDRPDVLYADEDCLGEGGLREQPSFKPCWSPDLLLSSMYLGRFVLAARDAVNRAGWFRPEFEGAHFYDLALRVAEQRARFRHVPFVLYSAEPAKPRRDREKAALSAAIQRRGWQASIEANDEAAFTIRRKLSGTPLASIIVCSRNPRLLKHCLRSVDGLTAYPVRETVVVEHKTGDDWAMERLLTRSHCIRVVHAGPFDFAAMNNRGAQAANGEVLIFLNDDVEPLSADWLKELLAQVQRPEVGVVGAKLLYPSGSIQHAGMAIGIMDGAGHPHRGSFGNGFWPWSDFTRNVSAVTGACLAIRRNVFEELGGFDPSFPVNYNDVDLCLRARQAGYEVVCETSSVLRHLESKTRVQGVSWQERELFFERWGKLVEQGDPYYSPHLTASKEDCSLSHG